MQRVYGNNVHLSEIAQIYQPQTISSTELTEDGFLVYGANGIIGNNASKHFPRILHEKAYS